MSETPQERRQRLIESYDHTHTPNGNIIHLGQTQDAEGEHCADCGISIYNGHHETSLMNTHAWNHKLDCPHYFPYPGSIAAQKEN